MRLVLTAVGALIGTGIAGPGAYVTDALFGALVGFGIAEIGDLRSRQRKLEADIKRLKGELKERSATAASDCPRHAQPRCCSGR